MDTQTIKKQIYAFLLYALISSSVHAQEPVRIQQQWELLVDDHLIDRMTGDVELRLHSPVAQEIVLTHDTPWEGNTSGYTTIFQDGARYRMYYRGWGQNTNQKQIHPAVVCYAESQDGIRWIRPDLGLIEYRGSKRNNIIIEEFGTHNFTPFKDSNPRCPREKLYKAVARGEGEDNRKLFAFVSADGIHWKVMQKEPIITEGAFDSQNLAFWDTLRREYRCYFRDFRQGYRAIKVSTSHDFIQWTRPTWLDYGEAPPEHLYTNQVQPYYRSPHIYIGFPTRYLPHRESLTEGLFMSSRDGQTFHRWQEALLRPGQNKDKWYNRSNYIWLGMVETESSIPGAGTELSIYGNESYSKGRGTSIRRYTYRIDGFVSLHASFPGGEVITNPLIFEGNRLFVNYATSAAGSLRIEIQDENGAPIEGYSLQDGPEIYGDEIDHLVKWTNNSVRPLVGKPVRLRFALKDADVFAFGFRKRD